MSRTTVNSIKEKYTTEVAVQYEQKVEKLDELLTRLDKYGPSRRKATLLTTTIGFLRDYSGVSELPRREATLLTRRPNREEIKALNSLNSPEGRQRF